MQEYAVLRWSAVAAFLVAAAMVVMRVLAPSGSRVGASPARTGPAAVDIGDHHGARHCSALPVVADHESEAAHLIMCLVMSAMLIFPVGANPQALHGVLTAVTVVFTVLLVSRVVRRRRESEFPAHRIAAIGYHVIAAAAMLYAMSGHTDAGHSGPAPVPVLALAALFCVDAVALLVTAAPLGGLAAPPAPGAGRPHRWFGHLHDGATLSSMVAPHLIMDLGMAYMLVAAVLG